MAEGQIGSAVIVIVGRSQPPTNVALLKVRARPVRNILKMSSAVTAQELGLLLEGLPVKLFGIVVDMTVGCGDVELAIEIGIEEDRAKTEALNTRRPDS